MTHSTAGPGEWLLVDAPPASGSFVMATGMVAVGMKLSGHGHVADALLAVCALSMAWMDSYFADWWVWVGLVVWAIVLSGLVRRIGRLAVGQTRGTQPG